MSTSDSEPAAALSDVEVDEEPVTDVTKVLSERELTEYEKKEKRKGIVSATGRNAGGAIFRIFTASIPHAFVNFNIQIHLPRIPPYMKPVKLRQLLEVYGKLGRIFLKPEGKLLLGISIVTTNLKLRDL